MRLIILLTFFLAPLFGMASFPIQISFPSDTIIESKKETMEEYKIRIQKQLYSNDNNLFQESSKKEKKNLSKWKKIHPFFRFLIIILGLVIVLIIGILINLAINPPNISFDLDDLSNE
tara:strand:- start:691 stop:1044 length:354 start_codon:yes stop_codon:yes gene_type:complete